MTSVQVSEAKFWWRNPEVELGPFILTVLLSGDEMSLLLFWYGLDCSG